MKEARQRKHTLYDSTYTKSTKLKLTDSDRKQISGCFKKGCGAGQREDKKRPRGTLGVTGVIGVSTCQNLPNSTLQICSPYVSYMSIGLF